MMQQEWRADHSIGVNLRVPYPARNGDWRSGGGVKLRPELEIDCFSDYRRISSMRERAQIDCIGRRLSTRRIQVQPLEFVRGHCSGEFRIWSPQ